MSLPFNNESTIDADCTRCSPGTCVPFYLCKICVSFCRAIGPCTQKHLNHSKYCSLHHNQSVIRKAKNRIADTEHQEHTEANGMLVCTSCKSCESIRDIQKPFWTKRFLCTPCTISRDNKKRKTVCPPAPKRKRPISVSGEDSSSFFSRNNDNFFNSLKERRFS